MPIAELTLELGNSDVFRLDNKENSRMLTSCKKRYTALFCRKPVQDRKSTLTRAY